MPYLRMITLWLLLGLVGCSEPEPLKIGFLGGVSGRVADLGIGGRNGVQLAVEEVNRQGGINGRPVELLVMDDRQDPQQARTGMGQLLDAGVAVVIGPMTSAMAMAVVEQANQRQVPLVSPTVTTTLLADKDDHFYRVIDTTQGYARENAQFQYQQNGVRSVVAAIDLNNRAYTESWFNDFRRAFESLGGDVLHVEGFHSSAQLHFDERAKALMAHDSDMILLVCNSVDAAVFAQQLRRFGYTRPITVSEWASTERLIELGGAAVEGMHVAQFLDRDSQAPAYVAFRDTYRQRFRAEPGFAGTAGYEAAQAVFAALRQQRRGQTLKQALDELGELPGLQEPLRFNATGDARRETYMAVIREGQFKVVE